MSEARARLRLGFACGKYDRTEALRTGDVTVAGVDLNYIAIERPREIFDRLVTGGDFGAAELSASEFIAMQARGDRRFVAIPVFPARAFRHSFIFVNRHAGISRPGDLAGRRIGVPIYTQTAAVWLRGHLTHQYGVDLSQVRWVQGAVDDPGSHGAGGQPALLQPANIEINQSGRSLTDLLVAGEIDVLLGARAPARPHPDVVRLFPNYRDVEQDFWRATGIFPIMHLVVLRRALHEREPWLAGALHEACVAAKDWAQTRLKNAPAHRSMLPWTNREVQDAAGLFGDDLWPYGVAPNRPTLQALVAYMAEQHLIAAPMPIDDLFVLPG
jgi:4,5-dihydroxyphthalate decarboxylase